MHLGPRNTHAQVCIGHLSLKCSLLLAVPPVARAVIELLAGCSTAWLAHSLVLMVVLARAVMLSPKQDLRDKADVVSSVQEGTQLGGSQSLCYYGPLVFLLGIP